ncbi:para-nitrobenzyl esterase [Marinactinospora thermotolerans DSM 45154]|uniref:Carboxylic ester hydrolase n=1 Tax=Marinactinospora thermotolerans DSM 45154 TaxID=1122192 RepID=A0A1T4TDY9_9ACTN|nr:carboxylesterase family protein [Marinactinospora thermotolerans]SKA38684.1 para-nitrobenzyl esterase [Marinactinospora thermotolerans DSM 45154]
MDVVVSRPAGALRGRWRPEGVAAFLGIPYAAPPFGPRRMRPPAPPAGWDGVRDALTPGPSAPQPGYSPAMAGLLVEAREAGEDCLHLNVWTPQPGPGNGGLPVMVWIHGGAFRNGAGTLPVYDGARLAAEGVVCVTLNYRLGPEGFLLLPDGTANLGLLDQIAALEWVRDNIALFGGDPDNVTVFGESAGAISIAALMTMPRARGLFRRAITQSGAGHHSHPEEIARRITERLASLAGVPATTEALAAAEPERLIAADTALRAEMARAADAAEWGESTGGGTSVLPVVDGSTLPARPVDAIAAGAGREIDLITGTNSDEFRLFLVPSGMAERLTPPMVEAVAGAYGLDPAAVAVYAEERPGATPGDLFAALLTDQGYRLPAIRLAEARASRDAGTYVYEFTRATPVLGGALGACHTAEIGFVFGNLADPILGENPPEELSARMRALWTSFARTGRPQAGGVPEWPVYGAGRNVMELGEETAVAVDPGRRERLLWEGIR